MKSFLAAFTRNWHLKLLALALALAVFYSMRDTSTRTHSPRGIFLKGTPSGNAD